METNANLAKMVPVQVEKVTEKELVQHLENLGLLRDLTPGEKNTYLQVCMAFNLNPFKREIHVSKYNGQMAIITGYETYIKRAERTGMLDGWSAVTTGAVPSGDLKAIVTIHRKDRQHPFVWEVLYSEYVAMVKDGNNGYRPNKFWLKAETMTKKVCISQAFRLCFSDELGGMPYTADEMTEVTTDISHEEVKKQEPKADNTTPPPAQKTLLSEAAIKNACDRISAGEVQLIQQIKDTFGVTPEQVKQLESAIPETVLDSQS